MVRMSDEETFAEVRQFLIEAIDLLEQTPLEQRLLRALDALDKDGGE